MTKAKLGYRVSPDQPGLHSESILEINGDGGTARDPLV